MGTPQAVIVEWWEVATLLIFHDDNAAKQSPSNHPGAGSRWYAKPFWQNLYASRRPCAIKQPAAIDPQMYQVIQQR